MKVTTLLFFLHQETSKPKANKKLTQFLISCLHHSATLPKANLFAKLIDLESLGKFSKNDQIYFESIIETVFYDEYQQEIISIFKDNKE